jgi:hypothetical protein
MPPTTRTLPRKSTLPLSPFDGVSSPLSPSQTRRGHLTATATAMATRPVPAMRPAPWRRPRQPALGQTSSHRKSRRSSVGPWQQLRQERLRKGRDGACDSPVLAKCRERLRQLPLVFRPDCADKRRMTRIAGDIAEVFHTVTSPCRREHGWLMVGFPYPGRNDKARSERWLTPASVAGLCM